MPRVLHSTKKTKQNADKQFKTFNFLTKQALSFNRIYPSLLLEATNTKHGYISSRQNDVAMNACIVRRTRFVTQISVTDLEFLRHKQSKAPHGDHFVRPSICSSVCHALLLLAPHAFRGIVFTVYTRFVEILVGNLVMVASVILLAMWSLSVLVILF